ncbi:hypothetical protein OKW42_000750 [Paraburkholderia sp. WC7.3d]|uniref:Uncharacterized protein n=1 Tax=Paraburkholderia podalyriae TaxID=1938811 RepID=A0ABR7PV03_9BURK|nr:hypothetical protein [Paraburkholderia podalyriae]
MKKVLITSTLGLVALGAHAQSSVTSHFAFATRSSRKRSTTTAMTTEGIASIEGYWSFSCKIWRFALKILEFSMACRIGRRVTNAKAKALLDGALRQTTARFCTKRTNTPQTRLARTLEQLPSYPVNRVHELLPRARWNTSAYGHPRLASAGA